MTSLKKQKPADFFMYILPAENSNGFKHIPNQGFILPFPKSKPLLQDLKQRNFTAKGARN